MATNYQRGRAFEYRTRDKLKKLGAAYVMRAAQSKGKVDLLALWPVSMQERVEFIGQPITATVVRRRPDWLVQCKRDGRISGHEAIELIALAEQTGSLPVLAKTGKNGRGVEFVNLNTKEPLGTQ